MYFRFLFMLLLLQAHECFALRGLGFVRHATLINHEGSIPSETSSSMKNVVMSHSKESSMEAKREVAYMNMDSKQIKPTEILQGKISEGQSMTESEHEGYEDDLEEGNEGGEVIVEVKDYVRSRGKSPIHN